MSSHERQILDAGGKFIRQGRHKIYEIDGVRITLHIGTRHNTQEEINVKRILKRVREKRKAEKGRPHDTPAANNLDVSGR